MPRKDPRLSQAARRIDSAERDFSRKLHALLSQYGAAEVRRAAKNPKAYVKAVKKDLKSEIQAKLKALLLKFGIRQVDHAGRSVAGKDSLPNTLTRDALAGKEVKIKIIQEYMMTLDDRALGLMSVVQSEVRTVVRSVLDDALAAKVTPSTQTIARSIRDRSEGLLSDERATTIARTELAQAENTGIMAGYQETGIKEIEWLAFSDGRSGKRHHEKLDGKKIKVGDQFTTPLGNKLRFPGDPRGKPADVVNCRCSIKPVRGGR